MAEYNCTRYTIEFVVRDTCYVRTIKGKWAFRYMGINDSLWKKFDTQEDAEKEMKTLTAPSTNGKFEIGTYIL